MKPGKTKYNELLDNIGQTIETARLNALKAVNTELVKANWEIGRHCLPFWIGHIKPAHIQYIPSAESFTVAQL